MGILRVTVGVESLTTRGRVVELPNTMVDTGSEYTWVPRDVLADLRIPVERIERFVTADGRMIARELGYAVVHAGGVRTADEVVFAEPGDMTLLGAHTIEGLNLRVDLKTKRLVHAGPVPAGSADTTLHETRPPGLLRHLRADPELRTGQLLPRVTRHEPEIA